MSISSHMLHCCWGGIWLFKHGPQDFKSVS
uniref:Uncharacterized protein n=1 Tax=Arundo donax TaxID=35708 RepID=A0A0A9ADM1_ARUDO